MCTGVAQLLVRDYQSRHGAARARDETQSAAPPLLCKQSDCGDVCVWLVKSKSKRLVAKTNFGLVNGWSVWSQGQIRLVVALLMCTFK